MRLLAALLFSTSLMTAISAQADPAAPAQARTPLAELGKDDPYLWMEEIEGTRALDWAKAQNARSLPVLQGDPRYAPLHDRALAILNAKDRIPGVSFAGDGSLRNYWQDAEHVRGLWRRTTLDNYRTRRSLLPGVAVERRQGRGGGARVRHPDQRLRGRRLRAA
jgi:prolyl oligopeptidase